jgi:hypothetical protein
MLAANFLTADELGLSELYRDALIHVLAMFERGEFVHVSDDDYGDYGGNYGFNMLTYEEETDACGTICCIAGWSDRLFNTNFVGRHCCLPPNLPEELLLLFSGPISERDADASTVADAAARLRTYLTTGIGSWENTA